MTLLEEYQDQEKNFEKIKSLNDEELVQLIVKNSPLYQESKEDLYQNVEDNLTEQEKKELTEEKKEELAVNLFLELCIECDFNLVERFYLKDFDFTKREIKKLVNGMIYISDPYRRHAVVLAKHYLVFEEYFDEKYLKLLKNNKKLETELYNFYKDCHKEETLEETSIASNSLYFLDGNDLANNDYFKIVAKYDSDQIVQVMIEGYDFSKTATSILIKHIAKNGAQKCFDYLKNLRGFDRIIKKLYENSIRDGKVDETIFLKKNGLSSRYEVEESIGFANVKFIEYLVSINYTFVISQLNQAMNFYVNQLYKNSLPDEEFSDEEENDFPEDDLLDKSIEMIDLLISSNSFSNIEILNSALENKAYKYIDEYLEITEPNNDSLANACYICNLETIKKIIDKGVEPAEYCLESILEGPQKDKKEIFFYFIQNYDFIISTNIFFLAIETQDDDIINFVISNDPPINHHVILNIFERQNLSLAKYLVERNIRINYEDLFDILRLYYEDYDLLHQMLEIILPIIELTSEEKERMIDLINDDEFSTFFEQIVPTD